MKAKAMTNPQKKAVERHRKRQLEKGIVRMEINLPEKDKQLLKSVAASLRAGGQAAEEIRTALRSVVNPYEGMSSKELLEAAPLEGVDLERSTETARDVEF
ncbi:MAG: hypothetical protein SH820_02875 [Xanthomonadales bacterium]|nr:hypothetical protein [Xanthomonadales bacterium]